MKFRKAFHKTDATGVMQSIGVDPSGRVFLARDLTVAGNRGEFYAQFTPDGALKFAFELANLARYAKTLRPRSETSQEGLSAVTTPISQAGQMDYTDNVRRKDAFLKRHRHVSISSPRENGTSQFVASWVEASPDPHHDGVVEKVAHERLGFLMGYLEARFDPKPRHGTVTEISGARAD